MVNYEELQPQQKQAAILTSRLLQLLKTNNCIILSRYDEEMHIKEDGTMRLMPIADDWLIQQMIEEYEN